MRPQRSRGIWLDDFEGQAFTPAGSTSPVWPDSNLPLAERRAQYALPCRHDLAGPRSRQAARRLAPRRAAINFIGRKTRYAGHYGHMGMAGHEIVVDRILSIKPCLDVKDC